MTFSGASTSSEWAAIVDAARRRDGTGAGRSTLVPGHLSQMTLFMLRQGVEFLCHQDSFGRRKDFINAVMRLNKVDTRLESVCRDFLLDGGGVWFFRPVNDLYRIHWIRRKFGKVYYDTDGNPEEARLIYSYRPRRKGLGFQDPAPMTMAQLAAGATPEAQQWIRLTIYRDRIVEEVFNQEPPLDELSGETVSLLSATATRETENSLGFIPVVEVFNQMDSTDHEGHGEFDEYASHIVEHNRLLENIHENLRFFGNPTLATSRSESDILRADDSGSRQRPTIGSRSGFAAPGMPSTRGIPPLGAIGPGGFRIPRLIANLEPTDRAMYLQVDAVSGDHIRYSDRYKSELRLALGGVDDTDISTAGTAYEIKSMYGRVAATAKRKARDLFTYGLCEVLEMMIYNEENLFRDSFSQAIGLVKPVPPLPEDFGQDPAGQEAYNAAQAKYDKANGKYISDLEKAIIDKAKAGAIPSGVVGLIPDGSRRVDWRWMGPIFEDSKEDTLNASIVGRNLQEMGVSSLQALSVLFPDKTEEERAALLTGYPFRMVQSVQSSIGSFLQMTGQMMQIPHPEDPSRPLAADQNLNLVPFVNRALSFLQTELSYSGRYSSEDPGSEPSRLSPADRVRADRGLPAVDDAGARRRNAAPGSGDGAVWRTWSAPGVPGGGGAVVGADHDTPIVGPGLRFSGPAAGAASGTVGPLGVSAGQPAGPMGSADFAVPTSGLSGLELGPDGPDGYTFRPPAGTNRSTFWNPAGGPATNNQPGATRGPGPGRRKPPAR